MTRESSAIILLTRESSAITLLMKKRISKRDREREREKERKGHTFQFDSVRVRNINASNLV